MADIDSRAREGASPLSLAHLPLGDDDTPLLTREDLDLGRRQGALCINGHLVPLHVTAQPVYEQLAETADGDVLLTMGQAWRALMSGVLPRDWVPALVRLYVPAVMPPGHD